MDNSSDDELSYEEAFEMCRNGPRNYTGNSYIDDLNEVSDYLQRVNEHRKADQVIKARLILKAFLLWIRAASKVGCVADVLREMEEEDELLAKAYFHVLDSEDDNAPGSPTKLEVVK